MLKEILTQKIYLIFSRFIYFIFEFNVLNILFIILSGRAASCSQSEENPMKSKPMNPRVITLTSSLYNCDSQSQRSGLLLIKILLLLMFPFLCFLQRESEGRKLKIIKITTLKNCLQLLNLISLFYSMRF